MFCATAACIWRSLRNMISRSCVFVCYPLVDPFICKNLMSDLLFGLLHLANRRSAWWTSGESGARSCWLCQQRMASSVFFFCTISVALPLLWSLKFLVFSLLSSHLLSLAVSRVKSFPITYRGISCTWTARWGPFLFLTSCFSHSLSYFSGYCTFITAQIKPKRSLCSPTHSYSRDSVHLLQFLCSVDFLHLLNADGVP